MTTPATHPVQPLPARPPTSGLVADRSDVLAEPHRFRVLTGDRPTGALHLGHYLGTLRERVTLQDNGIATFMVVADYQVVTDRHDTGEVAANVREVVLDYLAVGVDPQRTAVFKHSAVPELNQLMLPLLSLTTVSELRRNPTVKAETLDAGLSAISGLMLTYPVHQAADILAVRGNLVPVGEDQLPHLEQTRAVARRFAEHYPTEDPVLAPPQALLTSAARLLGTDGRKMSKSRGNAIELRDDETRTAVLLRRAVTDSEPAISYEPQRRPEVASLLLMAALCLDVTPEAVAAEVGGSGAAGLKAVVTEAVNTHLRPIRARRAELATRPGLVAEVLDGGAARVRPLAREVLGQVHAAMGL